MFNWFIIAIWIINYDSYCYTFIKYNHNGKRKDFCMRHFVLWKFHHVEGNYAVITKSVVFPVTWQFCSCRLLRILVIYDVIPCVMFTGHLPRDSRYRNESQLQYKLESKNQTVWYFLFSCGIWYFWCASSYD